MRKEKRRKIRRERNKSLEGKDKEDGHGIRNTMNDVNLLPLVLFFFFVSSCNNSERSYYFTLLLNTLTTLRKRVDNYFLLFPSFLWLEYQPDVDELLKVYSRRTKGHLQVSDIERERKEEKGQRVREERPFVLPVKFSIILVIKVTQLAGYYSTLIQSPFAHWWMETSHNFWKWISSSFSPFFLQVKVRYTIIN